MDNGEVIPGLNENWTFAGANAMEWVSGFVMFIISTEMFDKISRSMPLLIIIWLATTFLMALARNSFPDEERGMRNWLMTKAGKAPPNMPPASELQPVFSGFPMAKLAKGAHFNTLDLDSALKIQKELTPSGDDTGYARGMAGAPKKV